MIQNPEQAPTAALCSCCHQSLPLDAFYINPRTQNKDNYCRECRARKNREKHCHALAAAQERQYPVITRIQSASSAFPSFCTPCKWCAKALHAAAGSCARRRKECVHSPH